MRQRRAENARLKRLVAELTLDKYILGEVVRKSSEASGQTRAGRVDPGALRVERTQGDRAGAVFPWRVVCQSQARDQSALRLRIREIAHARPRFRYRRIHVMLRREGWNVNRKRVYRWYRFEGLQIRMRVRRRKHMSPHRGPVPQARRTHERWSMDFVHDPLFGGSAFRVLTIVDQFSRQTPLLEPRFLFGGRDVVAALDRAIERTGTPVSITIDHVTEFTSKVLEEWAYRRGVKLDFIHSGKPTENGHIESFNGRLRDECLNVMQFESIEDAIEKTEAWRIDYNDHRLHSSLGHLTPNEYAQKGQEKRTVELAVL